MSPARALPVIDAEAASAIAAFGRHDPSAFLEDRAAQQQQAVAAHPAYPGTLYPPIVFSDAGTRQLATTAEALLALIADIPHTLFGGDIDAWLSAQGIAERNRPFFSHQLRRTPAAKAVAIARDDALLTKRGFEYVEMNVSPALGGLGICDGYSERLKSSAIKAHLAARGIDARPPEVDAAWRAALRSLVWEDAALPERPFLFEAIADPRELPTQAFDRPEWIASMRADGIDVETGHVSALQITDADVVSKGRRVDIVYFCFTYQEMLRHRVDPGLMAALADADHAHAVNLFTSFATVPYDNKANLALLCAEEHYSKWSSERQALIRQCLPRTDLLTERNIDWVTGHRQTLVLKAGLDFGGSGVHIGATTSPEIWQRLARRALDSGTPTIAQAQVESIATGDWGDVSGQHRTICAAPILFAGRYAGTFLRASPYHGCPEVTNVARGAAFGTALARVAGSTATPSPP